MVVFRHHLWFSVWCGSYIVKSACEASSGGKSKGHSQPLARSIAVLLLNSASDVWTVALGATCLPWAARTMLCDILCAANAAFGPKPDCIGIILVEDYGCS